MSQKRKLFQGSSLNIFLAICFLMLAIIVVVFLSNKDFNYSKMQAATVATTLPTLTVAKIARGTGAGGTITSNPSGISCGARCSRTFSRSDYRVYLYATSNSLSKFVEWSGACTGKGQCSVVNNNTNKSVSATFCTNICTTGQRRCSGTTAYQICYDYNGDGCLEWNVPGLGCYGSGVCDYGTCTRTQRPQWYCSGAGNCTYTCYTDTRNCR